MTTKRKPGRPPEPEKTKRQSLTVRLCPDAIEYLDSLMVVKSRFIERLIINHYKESRL